MKRVVFIVLLIAVMMPIVAMATTPVIIGHGYYDDHTIVPFTFTNTTTTKSTSATKKGDSEQKWYITLLGDSNMSSSNVLGVRPRLKSSSSAVGSYVLIKKKVTGSSHSYYSDKVTKGSSVFLRLKKDSSSTDSGELYTAGRFCP